MHVISCPLASAVRLNRRVGNWCCGSCHKLATVHQLQVAEAVPVCQRCINQMLDKNMPVLVRTEVRVPVIQGRRLC